VVGLTGTGGAGKSSVVDELVRRFSLDFHRFPLAFCWSIRQDVALKARYLETVFV